MALSLLQSIRPMASQVIPDPCQLICLKWSCSRIRRGLRRSDLLLIHHSYFSPFCLLKKQQIVGVVARLVLHELVTAEGSVKG